MATTEERTNVGEKPKVWSSACRRISGFWCFISHHNCQLPPTREAAERMQIRRSRVRVVHRAGMLIGFRFRSQRVGFCFAVVVDL